MARKIFVCLIISLMLISQASATVQKFGDISVDVPDGWTASLHESELLIKSRSGVSSLSVSFREIGDSSLSDIVERLYIEREGVDLEEDDDGDYSFNFKDSSGAESIMLISGSEGYYLAVTMTGFEDESMQGDFETILDSIDWDE